jgi:large subunit ribosomal protein L4e
MKLKIITADGTSGKEIELPEQFSEEIREDLIKKAFLAIQNNRRQAYGAFEDAGDRHVSWVSKRRRDWRGCYGHGISRVPRKVLNHRGTQFFWVGAQAPGTRGGRKAHPPKSWKVWDWKLNTKEKRKAIRSAMSATMQKDIVQNRGHILPASYPFIIDNSFEGIEKTKSLISALNKLGFEKELERASHPKNRAGKGNMRGRTTKQKKSLLIVVQDAKKISKAAKNVAGVDIVSVRKLNVELLAPGSHYGRATLYSNSAIDELKKGLFTKNYSGERLQERKESNEQVASKKAATATAAKPVKVQPIKHPVKQPIKANK